MSTPLDEILTLQQSLERVRAARASVADLASTARGLPLLRGALPERFGAVLDDLLNRMESSALFSEESCSFSQGDLLDSLQLWLDKARQRLEAQSP